MKPSPDRLKAELVDILGRVGPENIWRPVFDHHNLKLSDGIADMLEGAPEDLAKVHFQDRTVLDLGCNFGFHTFLARQYGARRVMGIDCDRRVIRGADILTALHRISGIRFYCGDFLSHDFDEPFDIVLLVNFLGKRSVGKGIENILNTAMKLSRSQVIVSVRIFYHIERHLNLTLDEAAARYPSRYIRNGRLYLLEFVRDYFEPAWNMDVISDDHPDYTIKRTLRFRKKDHDRS